MDDNEVARRASRLPTRFADRVPAQTLDIIGLMSAGGEYGELTMELVASLAAHQAPVTAAERDELRGLLDAMSLPSDAVSELHVRD
jgi:hypothetical protein